MKSLQPKLASMLSQHEYLPFTPTSLGKAKKNLIKAQEAYTEAVNEQLDAKTSLEFQKTDLILQGLEGKNSEEREANLRNQLFDFYAHLAGCEAQLNEARKDVEVARIEWDCLRYKLRLFEATQFDREELKAAA